MARTWITCPLGNGNIILLHTSPILRFHFCLQGCAIVIVYKLESNADVSEDCVTASLCYEQHEPENRNALWTTYQVVRCEVWFMFFFDCWDRLYFFQSRQNCWSVDMHGPKMNQDEVMLYMYQWKCAPGGISCHLLKVPDVGVYHTLDWFMFTCKALWFPLMFKVR